MPTVLEIFNMGIGAAAIVVAIVSFYVAWKSLENQKKHNRLSVQPMPYVYLSKSNGVLVRLENHGFGPLKIVDFDILGGQEGKWNLVDYLPQPQSKDVTGHFHTGLKGRTIRANSDLNLVNLITNKDNVELESYIRQCRITLAPLTLRISYTGVYGEKFPPYEKPLIWFGKE